MLGFTRRYECITLYYIELQCILEEWVHILPSWFGFAEFYPEDGNCSEGVGGPGCAAELCIGLHCAVSSKPRVLKLWNYVLE